MRVLVTGGTGYVGSHTVAALVEGGHEVRLLVRDRQRVAPALAPLGLEAAELDTMAGDVTDPAAVDQAVRDCQAVVHAGSVYSLDSRDARRIRQVNVRGTDLLLGAAHRAGLDPIRCAARSDDARTRQELGMAPRDLQVTLADSVRWLFEQGHISRRQAGRLATG